MTLVLLIVALGVVAVGGFVGALALRSKRSFAAANEVVPGTPSPAPASWAGAHTPEAKLHRRLRDAVASLRSVSGVTGPEFIQARVMVESEAITIDERLVRVAAMPDRHRASSLAAVERAVLAVEDAVAAALEPGTGQPLPSFFDRVAAVSEIRQEMERSPESP